MKTKYAAAALAAFALLNLSACDRPAAEGSAASTPDFTGVWMLDTPATQLKPSDGSATPLTAWGQETYEKNKAAIAKGDFSVDLTRQQCASPGAVRMMTLPYLIEFFQRPHQLTMVFEWNHLYRVVHLDKPQEAPYPMAIGISNGKWESETLVVETSDLTDNTLLDSSGLPHSDQLKVTERIRQTAPDRLEVQMTLTDPKAFTKPWSVTLPYRKTDATGVPEDVCLDRVEQGQPAFPRL